MSVNPQNELPFCQIFNGNMMQYLFSMHIVPLYLRIHGKSCTLGTSHYLWRRGRRGHQIEMFFLVKILLIQQLKSQNFSLPNLKYQ